MPRTAASAPRSSAREYNPFTAGNDGDPYDDYRWLRDEHPAYHNERFGFYAFSRYNDVRTVSRDWKTFSNRDGVDIDHGSDEVAGPNFLDRDPPDHDYWRRLFQPRFAAKAIRAKLWHVIAAEIDRLLGEALDRDRGSIDLGRQFAWELPIVVTGELIGVPRADLHGLGQDLRIFQERDFGDLYPPQRAVEAAARLNDYIVELVRERRRTPGSDLVSLMAAAERDGEPLPDAEVAGNTFFFLDAGTHTTSSLLSQAIVLLDRHRDQRHWLQANRDRIDGAVEEFMRYEAPLKLLRRVTVREESMHGVTIPADSVVIMLYGAANRDDRKWKGAERLDLSREPERHMGFGEGIHFCMGAPIARFEAKQALEAILERMPDYEIDGPLERMSSHFLNGYTSIPVKTGLK